MIEIEGKLVSEELLQEAFVCDLTACKGQCCVDGDEGAPVEEDEVPILEEIYEDVKPFLRPEGIKAIDEQGTWIPDRGGDPVTPLVNGEECAYTVFDADGTAKCGIERAYRAGAVDFRKPVSCHLYPVRITRYKTFDAVNYERWDICDPARTCGAKLNVKVFRFLKEPLIRKYGTEWYGLLEEADRLAKNIEN